jgi:hypothetical protein
VIDLFSFFDFNECSCSASDIFEKENSVLELDFCMIPGNAFIQDQDLIGAVPSDFSSILFD